MKQLLLSLLLLAGLAPAARAQSTNSAVWCPPGATWTYGWVNFSDYGTLTVSYARDTLVAGQPVQLLTRQLSMRNYQTPGNPPRTGRLPSVLTRTIGDRVEVQANGQFYTLYNFAAQPGMSWLTPRVVPTGPCPSELVLITVDSVGAQQVAGRSLRWLRVHMTTPTGGAVLGQWAARIYEQAGSLFYLQPQSPTCGVSDPGYMGSIISFQATGWPAVTNTTTGSLVLATAQARATAAGFSMYPNPTTGLVRLTLPAKVGSDASLQLLDLTGRTVKQLPVPANSQLDLRGLPVGSYTLLLLVPGQAPLAQRLLLE